MMSWYTLRTDCLLLALLALYCMRGIYIGRKYSLREFFRKQIILQIIAYAVLCLGTLLICTGLIYLGVQMQSDIQGSIFPLTIDTSGTYLVPNITTVYFYVFCLTWIAVCVFLDSLLLIATLAVPFKKAMGIAFFSNTRLYLFALLPVYVFAYGIWILCQ